MLDPENVQTLQKNDWKLNGDFSLDRIPETVYLRAFTVSSFSNDSEKLWTWTG